MSVNDKITRLRNARSATLSKLIDKGLSIPDGAGFEDLPALIEDFSNLTEPIQIPSLSGRKVASGTFSLAADWTDPINPMYVPYGDIIPTAALVFPLNATHFDPDGNAIKSALAKFHFDISGAPYDWFRTGTILKNGASGFVIGSTASANINGMSWSNGKLAIGANASYPLRAGITYMWIVIGEEV